MRPLSHPKSAVADFGVDAQTGNTRFSQRGRDREGAIVPRSHAPLPNTRAFPPLLAQRLIIEKARSTGAFRRPPQYRLVAFGSEFAWSPQLQITGASVLRRIKSSKAAVSDTPHRSCGNVGRRFLLLGSRWAFRNSSPIIFGANHGYAEPQDCSRRVLAVLLGAQFLHDIHWSGPVGAHVLARPPRAGEIPLPGGPAWRDRPVDRPRRRKSILPAGDDARAANPRRENRDRRFWPRAVKRSMNMGEPAANETESAPRLHVVEDAQLIARRHTQRAAASRSSS